MAKNQSQHSDIFMILLRAVVIVLLISAVIPSINPARMSGLINKSSALITMALSYSSIVSGFTRALNRGWVAESALQMLYISSLFVCISIAVVAVGCCITLGKKRLQRLGAKLIAIASLLGTLALLLLLPAYSQISQTSNPDRVEPMFAGGFWIFLSLFIVTFVLGLINIMRIPKPTAEDGYEMENKYKLFLMILPFVILCFVFSYLPLWGWRYAFYDYRPGASLTRESFVGFKWFTYLFENPATRADIARVLRNTLVMSGLGIATSWLPMAFAIFLAEIRASKFRKIVQTCTTIPNFISWVLVYSVAFAMFSTEGFVNAILIDLGIIENGTNYLMSGEHIWLKMWAWGTWKGLGWSAIIYIAGISSIDQQLYEAATIDGAGRFKRMWYITVPGLMPTFFVLLLLSIANILSNGMDQYFVFKNAANKETIEVLDLYVYTLGLGSGGSGNIPLATVVGMLKSLISITLLFGANKVSKLIRGESII
ncbi:MAG: ABC transporter permease subunit [Caldicoprobacter oshimai]